MGFRKRPRLQYAIRFDAEIVMQSAGMVLLDNEYWSFGPAVCTFRRRLRRPSEVAFSSVGFQSIVFSHRFFRLLSRLAPGLRLRRVFHLRSMHPVSVAVPLATGDDARSTSRDLHCARCAV